MIEIKSFSKSFGNFYALKDVNIDISDGEVLGLVGENGAGKSTLIKILTGVYSLEEGEVYLDGRKVHIENPTDSQKLGINVIHQDRNLIPSFTGYENIYLGKKYITKLGGVIDWKEMKLHIDNFTKENGISLNLNKTAIDMTPPEQLLVELVRAMLNESRVLVLDEPTASLTDREKAILFENIAKIKEKGASIIYITHRMDEVFEISDKIAVLRNGKLIDVLNSSDTNIDHVISLMTDNWISNKSNTNIDRGDKILSVRNLKSQANHLVDISFDCYAGEVLGLYGLGGSGRTEILESIYGLRKSDSGEILLNDKKYENRSPEKSIKNGMILIPEDRRRQGIISSHSVERNLVLSTLRKYAKNGILNREKQKETAKKMIDNLDIKLKAQSQQIGELSGGNQQKVVFGKTLLANPNLYLCDEPTQAVDVKTREEIHNLIRHKARDGMGVVMVTSDINEMLEVSDRIVVIKNGESIISLDNKNLSTDEVIKYCY
ncbi:MAG TPA: sugar ABC transporter ATP-binding protein [Clostridiales bacterium]|jgi:ribose transport system ATP-binding protein|nr:sugar ABC transporter ATP-binding protein [Clostridiales bacterium]